MKNKLFDKLISEGFVTSIAESGTPTLEKVVKRWKVPYGWGSGVMLNRRYTIRVEFADDACVVTHWHDGNPAKVIGYKKPSLTVWNAIVKQAANYGVNL